MLERLNQRERYTGKLSPTQVLRRLVQARQITPARADVALEDFERLVIERHAHRPLLRRVSGLRSVMSAYGRCTWRLPRHSPLRCWPATTGDRELTDIRLRLNSSRRYP